MKAGTFRLSPGLVQSTMSPGFTGFRDLQRTTGDNAPIENYGTLRQFG
jgi:hypothetical protein